MWPKDLYTIDPKVGHLAIFVGTKVAIKNHAQFINNMELIETMPPGLYEIVITEKPGTGGSSEDEPTISTCRLRNVVLTTSALWVVTR